MGYSHVQRGPLGLLLAGLGLGLVMAGGACWGQGGLGYALIGAGVVFFVLAGSFAWLRIEDGGDSLSVRYGPLPFFGARVAYAGIESVSEGRSSVIDGWGVHYVPGRGWTYNLWGRGCVEVRRGGRVTRLGTDDAPGLAAFLRGRIGSGG